MKAPKMASLQVEKQKGATSPGLAINKDPGLRTPVTATKSSAWNFNALSRQTTPESELQANKTITEPIQSSTSSRLLGNATEDLGSHGIQKETTVQGMQDALNSVHAASAEAICKQRKACNTQPIAGPSVFQSIFGPDTPASPALVHSATHDAAQIAQEAHTASSHTVDNEDDDDHSLREDHDRMDVDSTRPGGISTVAPVTNTNDDKGTPDHESASHAGQIPEQDAEMRENSAQAEDSGGVQGRRILIPKSRKKWGRGRKPLQHGAKWTEDEVASAKGYRRDGMSDFDIAEVSNRYFLGLIEMMLTNWATQRLGRTATAVKKKLSS
jgi:hypothetical protein